MLLLSCALAADLVTDVGAPVPLAPGGNWARVLPADEGWDFFWAAGGDYNHLPMSDELVVVDQGRVPLTGRTNLVDHAIVRCPDGTLLHAASGNLDQFNDSAWAFRYASDLGRTDEGTIEERRADVAHNDLPLACGGEGRDLVGFDYGEIRWLGADLGVTEDALSDAPQLQGASFRWDGDELVVYSINYQGPLSVRRYASDLTPLGHVDLELAEPGDYVWWPQANLKIGQYELVAYMTRGLDESWSADTGNVWVVVLEDGAIVQKLPVTTLPPGNGAMRPGLARKDDRVIVSYDVNLVPTVSPLTLDLGDVAFEDTGDGTGGGGCGCGGEGGGAALLLLPGLWTRRRLSRLRDDVSKPTPKT